ncbi:MAG TPA: hypothetical protein VHH90_05625 [Polyangia bacterium]|nr:hypothetical protein [Polyangia bacterium]
MAVFAARAMNDASAATFRLTICVCAYGDELGGSTSTAQETEVFSGATHASVGSVRQGSLAALLEPPVPEFEAPPVPELDPPVPDEIGGPDGRELPLSA